MQKLFVGESTEGIDVIRSFSVMANGAQNIMVVEFRNGNFGYTNGDLVKSVKEIEHLPEVHRKRAEAWLKSREPQKAKEKSAHNKEKLLLMTVPQLELLAGEKQGSRVKKDDLVSKILEKQEEKE
jgi:hypothetical protein